MRPIKLIFQLLLIMLLCTVSRFSCAGKKYLLVKQINTQLANKIVLKKLRENSIRVLFKIADYQILLSSSRNIKSEKVMIESLNMSIIGKDKFNLIYTITDQDGEIKKIVKSKNILLKNLVFESTKNLIRLLTGRISRKHRKMFLNKKNTASGSKYKKVSSQDKKSLSINSKRKSYSLSPADKDTLASELANLQLKQTQSSSLSQGDSFKNNRFLSGKLISNINSFNRSSKGAKKTGLGKLSKDKAAKEKLFAKKAHTGIKDNEKQKDRVGNQSAAKVLRNDAVAKDTNFAKNALASDAQSKNLSTESESFQRKIEENFIKNKFTYNYKLDLSYMLQDTVTEDLIVASNHFEFLGAEIEVFLPSDYSLRNGFILTAVLLKSQDELAIDIPDYLNFNIGFTTFFNDYLAFYFSTKYEKISFLNLETHSKGVTLGEIQNVWIDIASSYSLSIKWFNLQTTLFFSTLLFGNASYGAKGDSLALSAFAFGVNFDLALIQNYHLLAVLKSSIVSSNTYENFKINNNIFKLSISYHFK